MKIKHFSKFLRFSFTSIVDKGQTPPLCHFYQKKPTNFEDSASILGKLSSEITNLEEETTFLQILDNLKFIKSKSKKMCYPQRKIISNYLKEIILKMNRQLLEEFQQNGLNKHLILDKKPDFYLKYLKELSEIDRLAFICFMREIDDLELHNTNILNKFTVISFEEDLKMKKKMFWRYMPYYVFFGVVGNTLYWIWALYYCFEYDVWLFDPRVTDYHVYRYS